jgi:hypothetical protein
MARHFLINIHMNKKKTSPRGATEAAKTLPAKKSSSVEKSLAGADLTQSKTLKQTSLKEASKAGKTLASDNSSAKAKSLAGSALVQTRSRKK